MGACNILDFEIQCPMCGKKHRIEAEFRFGLLDVRTYVLGEAIVWMEGCRPPDGNYVGEGYVECEDCHLDFWIDIIVENDVIKDIKIRYDKEGYIKPHYNK